MTHNGIDRLLASKPIQSLLQGKIGLLGHPASVTSNRHHSLDALIEAGLNISCAFGPQHGMRGDKQDNMVETADELDVVHGIPVFSLYGEVRRPTPEMLTHFDTLLVDLQDVGTRIYTFLTTLFYLIEDLNNSKQRIIVLDRPNPAGRKCEGLILRDGWESFVGGAKIQMRHGLTLGEAALWYRAKGGFTTDLHVVRLSDYSPDEGPGFGWPTGQTWINPSPNASSLNMARCFPGTVLLEGTTLSEGRGTTVPLEVLGAPDIDPRAILDWMQAHLPPHWYRGVWIRPMSFEPTFHKHQGKLCNGFQFHTDVPDFDPNSFHAFRLVVGVLKAIRALSPEYPIWRDFRYEYESSRLAFDLICGTDHVRHFVDGPKDAKTIDAFEAELQRDEARWAEERAPFMIYSSSNPKRQFHSNVV